MASYKTFTTCGDMGPWVSKIILELPEEARAAEVGTGTVGGKGDGGGRG